MPEPSVAERSGRLPSLAGSDGLALGLFLALSAAPWAVATERVLRAPPAGEG